MRFSKRFFVFTILIVIALIWKFNNWNDRYAAVEAFRGAALNEDVLYPLMSKNLNDAEQLKININGETYSNSQQYAILDDGLNPVGSLEFVRTIMGSSAFMSGEKSATVQITNDLYEFVVGEKVITKNGEESEITVAPSMRKGQIYLGLEDLCNIFGYEYSYDKVKYTVDIQYHTKPKLPATYDLRNLNRVSHIRNQGSKSTCWACASVEALESALLPAYPHTFSVDAMINENSSGDESEGGEYTKALAYLLSWQGPVEEDDAVESKPVHLQSAQFFDSENLDELKRAVYKYGGVSTSIYASVSTSNLNGSISYNSITNSYCYNGSAKPNHDVVIIGWDDNYPAKNFSANVEGNGAFICQNSWGDGFGDDGVFYISYYDSNIGYQAVAYVSVDTNNTYSYIYQSDLSGWVGQVGFGKAWAYAANTFMAKADQQVEATGFYALGKDTTYHVYFVPKYENTSSLSEKVLVAKGKVEQPGYYTIKFNAPQAVTKDQEFAVVLYLNTPDTIRPIAVEYESDEKKVDLSDGKGFISNNGLNWEHVEEVKGANLCIKAYANNLVEVYDNE